MTAYLFESDRDLALDRFWRNAKPMSDLIVAQLMKTAELKDLTAFFRQTFYRFLNLLLQLLLPRGIIVVMRRKMDPENIVDIFLFDMPVLEVIETAVLNGAVDIGPKGQIDQYRFPLLPKESIGVGDDLLGGIYVVREPGGEEAQLLIIGFE